MSETEKEETRKENFKAWLKNPYNFIFIGIFLLAIIIRIYYFSLTSSQPLWWDESVYMSYAKNLAGLNIKFVAAGSQLSLFSYIAALFFKFGLSEAGIKLLLEIFPSIFLVFLTYKICILMYNDKRIALISSFLMAVSWAVLFNSMRFHVDIPSLFFGFLSIYVFWKGYEKKEKIFFRIDSKWAIPLTLVLVLLTFTIRKGYFMFGFFFLFYMILTRKFKDLIKDKYNWLALIILIFLVLIGKGFLFSGAETQYHPETKLNLLLFQVFNSFFKNIFNSKLSLLFYLFWIGFVILVFELIFLIGYLKASIKEKSNLFVFLMLVITLSYFIFVVRDPGEPRWYFPVLLASFICISKASLKIADYTRKFKFAPIIVIILLIGYSGYYQLKHSDMIIKNKLETYKGVKDSSLFVKSISSDTDILISKSLPQTAYYSEREVLSPGPPDKPLEDFLSELKENKNIRFLLVSFWEPGNPEFMVKQVYASDVNGNPMLVKWEVPFMETTIDFSTGQQNIIQEKEYNNIKFKLINVLDRVFIYEIIHK